MSDAEGKTAQSLKSAAPATAGDGSRIEPAGSSPLASGALFASRYQVEHLLGSGAMGEVWAVLDQEVGERVALKLLTTEPDDVAERFRREVRLARRVTHRNVARTFDIGSFEGFRYLTMELVPGTSLKERLQRETRLGVPSAIEIAEQVAHGLAAAHGVDVFHRDLKPANVLLEPGGRVVLTDFGLARSTVRGDDIEVTLPQTQLLGTPAYMAPEQVTGGAIGPQTDLYAFGAVLYEMLTGRYPFVRPTAIATALARLEGAPDDPRTHAAMPEALAHLVLRCLERHAQDRPASALEVVSTLRACADLRFGGDAAVTLSSTASPGRSFFSASPGERLLAVLPLGFRGPAEQSYLADSITEELIDVLTMTRGLRVAAQGATARYRDAADPRQVGRELGVDVIVDGRLQLSGLRLRIAARLIEVESGLQLWARRFEGELTDVFELEESMARRIAEALRVELELLGSKKIASAEAIEAYLQARRHIATPDLIGVSLDTGIALLDRALALAPGFSPAQAALAEACVRRWFLPAGQNDAEVARRAHEAVADALAVAPHLAQTHLAAARLAVSDGRFGDAAGELAATLHIAPTYAAAHEYLGALQCEAGRGEEGERHIELARQLDPTAPGGIFALARRRALQGRLDAYSELIRELRSGTEMSLFALDLLEQRVAGWYDDHETLRRLRPASHFATSNAMSELSETLRRVSLGELGPDTVLPAVDATLSLRPGPRLASFILQMAAEVLAKHGPSDDALSMLRRATDSGVLVDADWLDRCPSLDPLRGVAAFAAIRGEVRRRANAIWGP